jgi:hypothetical protein
MAGSCRGNLLSLCGVAVSLMSLVMTRRRGVRSLDVRRLEREVGDEGKIFCAS